VIPQDLQYTAAHEWVRELGERVVRVGITDHAQSQLGEVESTKSVSDIYAPLTGRVVGVNEALADHPELVNSGPYEEGWMIDIEAPDGLPPDLLDASAYQELIGD
jgi:glycine cleavage system H protein